MTTALSARQLTGVDDSHLVTLADGHRLQQAAAEAFATLCGDAHDAGFELVIASSFRSYARQLAIWNGKACGRRQVHDDKGFAVDLAALPAIEKLCAIMRYSAIPGTSRHHWGTDLDVFDAAVLPEGYQLQLSPQEVAAGGLFDPLHCWLDERMAAGESRGFFRPYAIDRGGVAPERWHLSYAPLAVACSVALNEELLRNCWDCEDSSEVMALGPQVRAALPELLSRYVDVPDDWYPGLT